MWFDKKEIWLEIENYSIPVNKIKYLKQISRLGTIVNTEIHFEGSDRDFIEVNFTIAKLMELICGNNKSKS